METTRLMVLFLAEIYIPDRHITAAQHDPVAILNDYAFVFKLHVALPAFYHSNMLFIQLLQ